MTDDGVGLGDGSPAGVGFTAMRERAVELGSTLSIQAGEAAGTRVRARLPLVVQDDGRLSA